MQKLTRLFLLLVLGVAWWAPVSLADTTDTFVFRTLMSPANEVPPVTGVDASGTAIVWLHVVRDSRGAITGGSVDFRVDYRFPGSVEITGLHIHPAPAGVNGPVVIPAVTSAFTDEAGRGTISRQAVVSSSSNAAAFSAFTGILSRPDQYYVNLHTRVNPGGAIRGQLSPADVLVVRGAMSPANEVPPITGLDASGSGSVTVYATRDSAGAITSGTVNFAVRYSFPSTVNITGLHIHHPGAAGVNAGVTISSGLTTTTGAPATGTLNFWAEVAPTNANGLSTMETLFRNPDQAYINLHTSVNTGGAIRAQLQRTDSIVLRAEMSPANEVPPITGLEATGTSKVTLHVNRDSAGEITSGTVVFDLSFRGFPASTEFTGLHIHSGGAGVNGPVIISPGLSALTSADGTGNILLSADVPGSDTAGLNALRGLLANPANWYINLLTRVNPGGAIRAQEALGGEPEVRVTLDPGFYVVETALASGQAAGVWGLVALTGNSGGFNLGGGFSRGGEIPGFGAFLLTEARTVTLSLSAQALAGEQGPSVRMRLWDLQGRQVGDEVRGTTSATTTRSLQAGFYVIDVSSLAGAGTFQLGISADQLAAGGIAGGYLAPGMTGFAGFEVRARQSVSIQLFGKVFYGQIGAGNLVLTLKDSGGVIRARAQ